ncbi:MAG: four helix bundle protein [Phycisphaerae bacterium]
MKDFRRLSVWEKAHGVALGVYKSTRGFPADERYGLTSQLRRAGASIPTNIAEGCGRNSDGELARFLEIAMGSASEVEYLLLLAHELDYLDVAEFRQHTQRVTETKRMLAGLITTIRAPTRPKPPLSRSPASKPNAQPQKQKADS